MWYYLKVSHGSKTKKFAVRNPQHINIHQIKESFSPSITSPHLFFQLTYQPQQSAIFKSESALVQFMHCQKYPHQSVVKLRIYTCSIDDSHEAEFPLKKNNSQSEEIRLTSQTVQLNMKTQMQATQQFLFHSATLNMEKKEQALRTIQKADRKLKELQEKSTTTNIRDLVCFLKNR